MPLRVIKKKRKYQQRDRMAKDKLIHELGVSKYMKTHKEAAPIADEVRTRLVAEFRKGSFVSDLLDRELVDGIANPCRLIKCWPGLLNEDGTPRNPAVAGDIPEESIPF